jgi:DNA processing protein
MEIKSISIKDSKYLRRLEFLEKPPEKLYFYGKIPDFLGDLPASPRFPLEGAGRPRTVAIVGARKMTAYGENLAFKIAKELSEAGVIIVSGMAVGIDAAAHKGALAGGGRTIAFLGTPINKIYPSENKRLFDEILAKDGCVLSELSVDQEYHPKTSFLERNRLISGISDAVIVVEADERSGSLNTASHALEQGVPLFAVPGDVSRQMSRGCNALFNKGATAITSADDILNTVFPEFKRKRKKKLSFYTSNPDEKLVLEQLSMGITSGDEVFENCKKNEPTFDISRYNLAITTLEIRGVVKREFGNNWVLV